MDKSGTAHHKNLSAWKRLLCAAALSLSFLLPIFYDDHLTYDVGTLSICGITGLLFAAATLRYINHNPHHFTLPNDSEGNFSKSMIWIDWNHFMCIMIVTHILRKAEDTAVTIALLLLLGSTSAATFVRMRQFSQGRLQANSPEIH